MFFSIENDSLISAIEICREEIKVAYIKLCIKWHPDKNINIDTAQRMQDINQVYLILKDEEARSKYDIEYLKFKGYKSENINNNQYKYTKDNVLEKWMQNAEKKAKKMVFKELLLKQEVQ